MEVIKTIRLPYAGISQGQSHRIVRGLDMGFHSKVFGLRTWEDGSGIGQDREDWGQAKLEGDVLEFSLGHVNPAMSIRHLS